MLKFQVSQAKVASTMVGRHLESDKIKDRKLGKLHIAVTRSTQERLKIVSPTVTKGNVVFATDYISCEIVRF